MHFEIFHVSLRYAGYSLHFAGVPEAAMTQTTDSCQRFYFGEFNAWNPFVTTRFESDLFARR